MAVTIDAPTVVERLTALLQHRRTGDATSDAILDAIIGGLADGLAQLGLVAFGDPETGAEGNRVLTDPRYAEAWSLAHAAQYVGAILPGRKPGETAEAWLARARDAVIYPLGIKRGSYEAINRVVKPLLTGTQSVFIASDDANPYGIVVRTLVSETPDPAAVQLAIEGDYVSGGARGALRAELKLTYLVSDEVTFAEATRDFDLVANTVTGANVTREDVT